MPLKKIVIVLIINNKGDMINMYIRLITQNLDNDDREGLELEGVDMSEKLLVASIDKAREIKVWINDFLWSFVEGEYRIL